MTSSRTRRGWRRRENIHGRAAGVPLALSLGVAAHDGPMQPLPYNHPGLHVDLGVGLWAWPVPWDVDGDGDEPPMPAGRRDGASFATRRAGCTVLSTSQATLP